jgi:hypothetical protein
LVRQAYSSRSSRSFLADQFLHQAETLGGDLFALFSIFFQVEINNTINDCFFRFCINAQRMIAPDT